MDRKQIIEETQEIARAFVASEIREAREYLTSSGDAAGLGAVEALAMNIAQGTPNKADFLATCGMPERA